MAQNRLSREIKNLTRPKLLIVWFVLDELASLQKLPQLATAFTLLAATTPTREWSN